MNWAMAPGGISVAAAAHGECHDKKKNKGRLTDVIVVAVCANYHIGLDAS